ncbi:MAG: ATP-binding protein [Pseudomonadota bacterium]|nr:ATP-binding protein [Pseudomonadota bacterium]
MVKSTFPNKPYANLEIPDVRLLAKTDPNGFLSQYPNGAVLDEIQRVPELLSYIQAIVDENNKPGLFIITGSHQIELHQAISQSLAGRIGLLSLYPLTQNELHQANIELELDNQIYHGFYPGIYSDNLNPTQAYRFYVQTYLEKDVQQISNIQNLILFQNFMKLCAGRIGQLIDYASLSNEIGVSTNTIKNWISVLEASYIIIRLKPYFENFGKRIIKSPKLYFTDVGLAAYLLDIQNAAQVSRDPLRGFLIENLSIMELCKYRHNRGMDPNMYFFRDSRQNEVDVLIKHGNILIPVEIKSAQTFDRSFLKGIQYFKNLVPDRIKKSYLVYSGNIKQFVADVQLINYREISSIYTEMETEHNERRDR